MYCLRLYREDCQKKGGERKGEGRGGRGGGRRGRRQAGIIIIKFRVVIRPRKGEKERDDQRTS